MNVIEFLKKNLKNVVVVVILLLIFFSIVEYQNMRIRQLNERNERDVKLRNALLDSMDRYRNDRMEWVVEKLSMQETIKNLNEISDKLTANQKELIRKINEVDKYSKVIAAALIATNLKLDSLKLESLGHIDTLNKKISFTDRYKDNNKEFVYGFTIDNVIPYDFNLPNRLTIDSLYFPNTQYIDFKWKDDKKNGYPISFTVTNSNDFFNTSNVDSYVIPNIIKEEIEPTGWDKFIKKVKIGCKNGMYIGIGVGVGILGTLFIVK